jgi:hypothetical protein
MIRSWMSLLFATIGRISHRPDEHRRWRRWQLFEPMAGPTSNRMALAAFAFAGNSRTPTLAQARCRTPHGEVAPIEVVDQTTTNQK